MHMLFYELEERNGWICIDKDVENLLPKSGEGMVMLFSQGSTSSLILIENDTNLLEDLFDFLDTYIPFNKDYKHHLTWNDDNGASHLRASLLGQSLILPFKNGKLVKGQWQNIVLINHDTRRRERRVMVVVIS